MSDDLCPGDLDYPSVMDPCPDRPHHHQRDYVHDGPMSECAVIRCVLDSGRSLTTRTPCGAVRGDYSCDRTAGHRADRHRALLADDAILSWPASPGAAQHDASASGCVNHRPTDASNVFARCPICNPPAPSGADVAATKYEACPPNCQERAHGIDHTHNAGDGFVTLGCGLCEKYPCKCPPAPPGAAQTDGEA